MVISHNLIAMNADRMLGINNKSKSKSTEKLASGYKINRAADDAAGLAISEKMRRQVRGLTQAAANIQDGISLVNVADGALNEIHDILQRQRELLIKAANGTNSEDDLGYIEKEIESLSGEFDRIFETTTFNERKIFRGKDDILNGPTVNSSWGSNEDEKEIKTSSSKVVWLPKGETPTNSSTEVPNGSDSLHEFVYSESEEVHEVDENGHTSYDIIQTDTHYITQYEYSKKTDIKYTKITDPTVLNQYIGLQSPKNIIDSRGYVSNLRNIKGDMSLSCAMSQLGLKIDGNLVSQSVFSSAYSQGTTYSADGNTATTKYNVGNNMELTQVVQLQADNTYQLSYSVVSTDSVDHTIELRFAFDTMNTPANAVNNGSKNFVLESEDAKISISGTGSGASLSKAMLGSINDLYLYNASDEDAWNGNNVIDGANIGTHTGVSYWWDGTVSAGGSLSVGSVSYGPIELKKETWIQDTEIVDKTKTTRSSYKDITTTTYMPEYLDIQAGTEKGQHIPIRLWSLSADELRVGVPDNISAFSATNSLEHIDHAMEKISSIRSYYGAMTNRLEHAYNIDLNTAENTQYAESMIRDTDMAKEMVALSMHNILTQAGEAMLAQANQSNQGVLSLLQ